MPEQHIQLMKGLGYSDEQIQQVETMTPEQLKEFKPEELVEVVQTNMKNSLTNDATFLASIPKDKISPTILKEIEKGQYARFQNELVEVATKQLGLEDKELTEEDRKSIKGLAYKMATTYMTKTGNVEGLKKMQGELSEALQAIEKMKGEHTENLTKELEKVNGAHTGKLIKTLAKVELQGLKDVKLSVGAGILADPVLAEMNSRYTVVVDANDNLDIKQKADANLDVLDKAGKKITFSQAMKEIVIEKELGVVDDGKGGTGGKPGRTKVVIDGNGEGEQEVVLPSHIQAKIDQNPDAK